MKDSFVELNELSLNEVNGGSQLSEDLGKAAGYIWGRLSKPSASNPYITSRIIKN